MTTHTSGESPHDCRLSRFERNRFYHQKLMTARDMFAEQRYHADRLDTLARHVAGEGIVHGLGVAVTGTEPDELTVEVPAGVGLDCCGRLIVVDDVTTKTVGLSSGLVGETVHLYLEYDDCVKETVPLLGSESACEQQCEYNRVLETFDIVTGDHPYEAGSEGEAAAVYKRVPEIAFPDPTTVGPDPAAKREALFGMAHSYHEQGGTIRHENAEQCRVYLGSFSPQEQNGSTAWVREEITPGFVYTADMLFAIAGGHILDDDNPHGVNAVDVGAITSVEGVENDGGNVDLHSPDDSVIIGTETPASGDPRVTLRVAGTSDGELDRYLMDRTLKYMQEAYRSVAAIFESHVGDALQWLAGVALDEGAFTDPEEFSRFLNERAVRITIQGDEESLTVVELMAELERDLAGLVVTEDLSVYTEAVSELESALNDGATAREVAVALDYASETATWIEWNLTCVDFDRAGDRREFDAGEEFEALTFVDGARLTTGEVRSRPGEREGDASPRRSHEVLFEDADESVFEGLFTGKDIGIQLSNQRDSNEVVIDVPTTSYVEVKMADKRFDSPNVYFLDAYRSERGGEVLIPVDRAVRVFNARPDREFSLQVQGEEIDRIHIEHRFGGERAPETEALILEVCYQTEP